MRFNLRPKSCLVYVMTFQYRSNIKIRRSTLQNNLFYYVQKIFIYSSFFSGNRDPYLSNIVCSLHRTSFGQHAVKPKDRSSRYRWTSWSKSYVCNTAGETNRQHWSVQTFSNKQISLINSRYKNQIFALNNTCMKIVFSTS